MNIFYYSVHQVLEDDEVRLLQRLGHNVFCLGVSSRHGASQSFRKPLRFNETELALYEIYERLGGKYFNSKTDDEMVPPGFIQYFSLCIIMHSQRFISQHWDKLKFCPVVWRTIGQAVGLGEETLRPFRGHGLYIVRYSPVEKTSEGNIGEDALIRFGKVPESYPQWTGNKKALLTFSNNFSQRYPHDAEEYRQIVADLPSILGGSGNGNFDHAIGMVDEERQVELYCKCSAYIHLSGLDAPYTLSFIEAWMAGIPVIVYAPTDRIGRYFEIDKLIVHEETGFICRDIPSARYYAQRLLWDRDLAAKISSAGRAAAIQLFGMTHIEQQWRDFIRSFEPPASQADEAPPPHGISRDDVVSLYRCFLGRSPESEGIIQFMIDSYKTFEDARIGFAQSDEFQRSYGRLIVPPTSPELPNARRLETVKAALNVEYSATAKIPEQTPVPFGELDPLLRLLKPNLRVQVAIVMGNDQDLALAVRIMEHCASSSSVIIKTSVGHLAKDDPLSWSRQAGTSLPRHVEIIEKRLPPERLLTLVEEQAIHPELFIVSGQMIDKDVLQRSYLTLLSTGLVMVRMDEDPFARDVIGQLEKEIDLTAVYFGEYALLQCPT